MAKIKEILCLHHSHLDIGYTHPQPLLLELQKDYIDEAIKLCLQSENEPEDSKFRWTCEATYPVMQWLETAAPDQISDFRRLLQNGQLSIAALPMHTTPLVHADQLARMLQPVRELRERFDISIKTAMNHDVNGQPWPLSQVLLDAGIEFYITGINVHFGGIPLPRPAVFNWRTPDNRQLLTFLGEHYSLFSQFFHTNQDDTELMAQGIKEYIDRLEGEGYPYDFVYLTATNPPQYDNNCPDPNLLSLIRRYNAEGHDPKVIFATPEMLLDRVRQMPKEQIQTHSGDWTDYWNFGAGSSAKETKIVRRTKQSLKKADFLEAIQGAPNLHYTKVKNEALEHSLLYDEHTWGSWGSVSIPDHPLSISMQLHKRGMAYRSADLSAYVYAKQMEGIAGNPEQSSQPGGVMLVNTSSETQYVDVKVPEYYLGSGRHLAASRVMDFLPYTQEEQSYKSYGTVEMAPFSWKKIPFAQLEARLAASSNRILVTEGMIETPFYRMTYNPASGRIVQLFDKIHHWPMIDEKSPWTLFEFVQETVDGRFHHEHRSTLFPRDVDKGNRSISVWNHEWKSKRVGANRLQAYSVEQTMDSVTFVMQLEAPGVSRLEQRITFSAIHHRIQLSASMNKSDIRTPESIYFAFPLRMDAGWRSYYDTAGLPVELDREQLGTVCRDWVTVDQTVSIYDRQKGVTLACPDAPLVQIGDFHFGKESKQINRQENPLLLAWAMNNYWDTNFWASQPGDVLFRYELSPFEQFDPVEAYRAGIAAANPIAINAAVMCDREEEGQWFGQSSGTVVLQYMKPALDGNGFIMTLRNVGSDPSEYILTVMNQEVEAARLVNPLEEVVHPIPCSGNDVHIGLQPGELAYLQIILK
ncbi:hypothetical protein [Paenibacillus sp. XY044]|uniref:glycoside hydrolase family 38 N-terminal domain-containing protein n=1 Tax=Paenibacillus sp. XY044 TaxID=2026089 RepID=UPI000B98C148|nr:hypothetical protein [Paenibacillus sp. XY044]OZB95404.1 hypothetical protein CJP46_17235 [Paenibacillus sp. XY044]